MNANALRTRYLSLAVAAGMASLVGAALKLHARQPAELHRGMVYTHEGFGAWVTPGMLPAAFPTDTPLHRAILAYTQGRWADVEREAPAAIAAGSGARSGQPAHDALEARSLLAYTAARQKQFSLAANRFEDLRQAASECEGHGIEQARIADPLPTFEEEAAYEHAVCTAAAGDPQDAEYEYRQFMTAYPQSVLVAAVVHRERHEHHGQLPADIERLYFQAIKEDRERDAAIRREQAMCGPKCVAELLRRQGKRADVHALADEMQTGSDGTEMAQIARVAGKHGLPLAGAELTERGLERAALPAIALVRPGHFVLVESAGPGGVKVWDPGVRGAAEGRAMPANEWMQTWSGDALISGR